MHHPIVIATGGNPAHAQAWRHGFGKGVAQQHPAIDVERVNRAGARVLVRQLAVDIIFKNNNIVALGQRQQLAFTGLRHDKTERIVAVGHHNHPFDRPLLQGQLQRFNADPGLGIGGDLDGFDTESPQHLHRAVERGRFKGHDIARLADRQQRQGERAMASAGDDQIVGGHDRSGIQHQPCDLLAQFPTPR